MVPVLSPSCLALLGIGTVPSRRVGKEEAGGRRRGKGVGNRQEISGGKW